MTGLFIALEGGEGTGKDTQIDLLKGRLDPATTIFTREPGGTELGEEVRAVILKERHPAMSPETELLLFLAARAELMQQVVRPALEEGKTVISNRFGLSTIAYQIYGRERPHLLPFLKEASEQIVGKDRPHYILLDMDPKEARPRVESRGAMSRFDADSLAFHSRVRCGYLTHVHDGAESFIINADRSIEAVASDIQAAIAEW